MVFTLMNLLESKIFNFNKFVINLNVKVLLDNNSTFFCYCKDSLFVDKDHSNITKVNLKIINNKELPKLLSKGPTNRENRTADYQNPLENIIAYQMLEVRRTHIATK